MTLLKKPRYILEEKCTGCTTCVEYCPVKYPDKFNQEISDNKAIHVYFAQAIPLVTYIDESCLYLKEKKCRICEAVCKNEAIDFTQAAEKEEVNVGAIILSPGFEPFDPKVRAEYRYGEFQNVVTSMDFERLLSSTGAYAGRDTARLRPEASPEISLDSMRRVETGPGGGQQLLFGRMLHLYPETGDLDEGPSPGVGVHHIPQRCSFVREGF